MDKFSCKKLVFYGKVFMFWMDLNFMFWCEGHVFMFRILNRILNSVPRTIRMSIRQILWSYFESNFEFRTKDHFGCPPDTARICLTSERVNFEFQRTNSDVHQKIHWTVRPQRTNSDLHHEFHSNSEYCGGNLRWFRWLLEECSESKAYASLARSRGGRRCTPLAV